MTATGCSRLGYACFVPLIVSRTGRLMEFRYPAKVDLAYVQAWGADVKGPASGR